ncbi:hypothetical protein ACFLU5_14920 [Bacteroidota bacterium]
MAPVSSAVFKVLNNEGIINLPDDKNNIVEEVTIQEDIAEESVEVLEEKVEEPPEQTKEEPIKKSQEEGSFFDELD